MQPEVFDGITYYLPTSISDLQELITTARQRRTQIRIRGAHHSVPASVLPDPTVSNGEEGINVMLSKMNSVTIDKKNNTVTVDAGCHLGYDPIDPTGISTWENSLFCQLDAAGYAVPDMGGIIHQTVGGFLSTGSSGGSTKYSFSECLIGLTFLPADKDYPQPIKVWTNGANKELFYAVGVSMGLLGIITSATFSLVKKFNITGIENITTIDDCAIDMTGEGATGKRTMREFLTTTEYARILWYPQPGAARATVWQASQMPEGAPFTLIPKPKPYRELPLLANSFIPVELAADAMYTAMGRWPVWFGRIVGTNSTLYTNLTALVNNNFYTLIFPHLLDQFVTLDKNRVPPADPDKDPFSVFPQQFQDYWYSSLPMDNNINDKLFPVEFTELWIPFDENDSEDKVAAVLQKMNALFNTMYANGGGPFPDGAFCTELYAAKKSNFWMSPAYGTNVFRVDVFWFGNNMGNPRKFYQNFWDALEEFDFRCHWGKYLPAPDSDQGVEYLRKQLPKWDDFMALREKFDPLQVFVNDYWRKHLGIKKQVVTFQTAFLNS